MFDQKRGGCLPCACHVVADPVHQVDGEVVVFLGAFLVQQPQDAVAARLEADGDHVPVGLRDQRLEQVGPLAHGVGAAGRPVGPALVGLAGVLLDPLLQPARVLEEHRVVDDERADAVVVVQVVELVDHLVHRLAAHVGHVGALVAEDALPRADAAGDQGGDGRRPPAALRLQRPVEAPRQLTVRRLGPQGAVDHRPLGHGCRALALEQARERGRVAHQVNDHLLARALADLVELRHFQHLVRGDGRVHAAGQHQPAAG